MNYLRKYDYYAQCGFPGGPDSKEFACNAGDLDLIPGSGRCPGEKEWLPTPVFLPRELHGQRSMVGYSPWGWSVLCTIFQLYLIFQTKNHNFILTYF